MTTLPFGHSQDWQCVTQEFKEGKLLSGTCLSIQHDVDKARVTPFDEDGALDHQKAREFLTTGIVNAVPGWDGIVTIYFADMNQYVHHHGCVNFFRLKEDKVVEVVPTGTDEAGSGGFDGQIQSRLDRNWLEAKYRHLDAKKFQQELEGNWNPVAGLSPICADCDCIKGQCTCIPKTERHCIYCDLTSDKYICTKCVERITNGPSDHKSKEKFLDPKFAEFISRTWEDSKAIKGCPAPLDTTEDLVPPGYAAQGCPTPIDIAKDSVSLGGFGIQDINPRIELNTPVGTAEWQEYKGNSNDVESVPQGFAAQVLEIVRNRGGDYGTPADNHELTATLWTEWLSRRFGQTVIFTAEDVVMLNILQKCSRLANKTKDDSYLDICGYVENVAMLRKDQRNR